MAILCISDKTNHLLLSKEAKELFKDITLIIACGDLELSYLDAVYANLEKEIVFVFGNHHLTHYKKFISGDFSTFFEKYGYLTCLESKMIKRQGLLMLGFGGCRKYNNGAHQYSEMDMFFKILKKIPHLLFNKIFYKRYIDILVTHAPPRFVTPSEDQCHMGFKMFDLFCQWFKPKYVLHGHVHVYDLSQKRVFNFKGTDIVNCYDYYQLCSKESVDETAENRRRFQKSTV